MLPAVVDHRALQCVVYSSARKRFGDAHADVVPRQDLVHAPLAARVPLGIERRSSANACVQARSLN